MGFTVPEIDKILEPYAQKTYDNTYKETVELLESYNEALEKNKLLAIKGSKKPVIVNTVFWHYCC